MDGGCLGSILGAWRVVCDCWVAEMGALGSFR